MLSSTWSYVGAIGVGALWFMVVLSKNYSLTPLAWVAALGGNAIVLFGIAWTVGSIVEGEAQAAALGATFFTGAGLVILALTWRLLIAPSRRTKGSQG